MNSLVKNVFLMIMGVVVAMVLYVAFFGIDAVSDTNFSPGVKVDADSNWQGILWIAAKRIETPISYYYHAYCYTPNVSGYDYVTKALGATIHDTSHGNCREAGKAEPDDITVPSSKGYSTGWQ